VRFGVVLAEALRLDVENDAVVNESVYGGDRLGSVRKDAFSAGGWLI